MMISTRRCTAVEKKKGMDFDEDEMNPDKKKKNRNPMGANSEHVQAWFRLIIFWAVLFCSLRVTLFAMFPPKHKAIAKKKMPERPRKPPPPKPLPNAPMLA